MYSLRFYFKDKSLLSFVHNNDMYDDGAIFDLITEFERIYDTSLARLSLDVLELSSEEEKK